ncbi:hypothetical protein [Bacillus sp. JCM 19041]
MQKNEAVIEAYLGGGNVYADAE